MFPSCKHWNLHNNAMNEVDKVIQRTKRGEIFKKGKIKKSI